MKISTVLMPEDKFMFIPNGIKSCLYIFPFHPFQWLKSVVLSKTHNKRKGLSDYELKNTPHSAGIWMINEFYFKALIPLSAFCFFLCQVAITAQGRALLLTDPSTFLHSCS